MRRFFFPFCIAFKKFTIFQIGTTSRPPFILPSPSSLDYPPNTLSSPFPYPFFTPTCLLTPLPKYGLNPISSLKISDSRRGYFCLILGTCTIPWQMPLHRLPTLLPPSATWTTSVWMTLNRFISPMRNLLALATAPLPLTWHLPRSTDLTGTVIAVALLDLDSEWHSQILTTLEST